MTYELLDRFQVAADIDRVWTFFSTAENLPLITPPWLNFTIRTSGTIGIEKGTLLDYSIRWIGISLKWRTKIIEWNPPLRFVDLQVKGPYALWHHEHRFEPVDGGVVCSDRVQYRLPLGIIGRITHSMLVRRQLMSIFRYRRQAIAERLAPVRALQEDVRIQRIDAPDYTPATNL